MEVEWIAVAQDRVGKIEDIVICNSVELARKYSEKFAKNAPDTALIRIFRAEAIETRSGLKET
jgi:hypothetical protein